APAFWPWTQVLETILATMSRADAIAALTRAGSNALDLLPAWIDRAPELTAPGTLDADSARFAAGRALVALIRGFGFERASVLVLDDLHAADQASLQALRFVARELRSLPTLIVGTFRDVE